MNFSNHDNQDQANLNDALGNIDVQGLWNDYPIVDIPNQNQLNLAENYGHVNSPSFNQSGVIYTL